MISDADKTKLINIYKNFMILLNVKIVFLINCNFQYIQTKKLKKKLNHIWSLCLLSIQNTSFLTNTTYYWFLKEEEEMVTSAWLEHLLIKHCNQIDKEHIDLFLSIINWLRMCNISKISYPFLCINTVIHYLKFTLLIFADVKHFMKNIS